MVVTHAEIAVLGPVQTIALLEPGEFLAAAAAPPGTVALPMANLVRLRELASQGPTVLTCRHGLRSAALARLLRAEGWPKIYAVVGPMAAIQAGG